VKRFERRRLERRQRLLLVVGLSFALGALSAVGLTWRLGAAIAERADDPPSAAAGLSETEAEIASLERSTGAADRPAPAATTGSTPAAAPAAAIIGSRSGQSDLERLRRRELLLPVEGIGRSALIDTYSALRAGGAHEAIDIMAPRGTPVRSVEDGTVARLFTSKAGGLTIYTFDPSEMYSYYYAHLDRYAAGLREGQAVSRGQVLGYVGSTGNASENAPHLHFAIFRLTAERQWWKGEPINPYRVLE
jgi:peptidoglycan LD-endopeptidase LytH